jgi:uncharacterized membrane protein
MMAANRHPLAERYLAELRVALSDLPRRRRDELVAEIQAHLDETAPPGSSDAQVAEALDRLGDPEHIAEEERERSGFVAYEAGWMEYVAIPFLLVGGVIIPFLGWMIGVVLLWLSRVWTVRDKLWGTLLLPGGLLPAFGLLFGAADVETCTSVGGGPETCTGGISTQARILYILLLIVCIVAPVVTAIRLGRALRR